MPLVTISLSDVFSSREQRAVADGVHGAIVGAGFPEGDRFQKIHLLTKDRFIFDASHPNLPRPRSERFVLIEIVISKGRTREFKKDLLMCIIHNLGQGGVAEPKDIMVLFLETDRENWAFTAGIQHYVEEDT